MSFFVFGLSRWQSAGSSLPGYGYSHSNLGKGVDTLIRANGRREVIVS